ncbi:peroxiredoxin [Bradymonas sediminis]|uniref:Peroxiredoxin n=1 Tax=Bradymonas sediminis TaxID=1548548 RepID=A0A2Z4FM88_9DELT|nr:peroxiredoxin [Bradymonas sediminis]AWV89950.1 peroxiredoxin [Bradymonas sediminis]TDP62171.1 peroxiredoxin (alkyl hydroperoxide reductase subunit C) [Bradymonas sediminis]
MSIMVGQKAPEFTTSALVGRDITEISLSDYSGKWVVLFFYPMDFTFVCPTELVDFNNHIDEFEDRDAVLLGGSTDTAYSHLGWVKSHEDLGDLKYPLFADVSKQMALDYGILHPEDAVALRGTFIIDPEGNLRWVNVNDLNVGRSVQETLRVLDALQTDELCACGREVGGATLEL